MPSTDKRLAKKNIGYAPCDGFLADEILDRAAVTDYCRRISDAGH
ncbi:hypothetical protein AB0890_09980 [Streptomyces sp. NPDC005406]